VMLTSPKAKKGNKSEHVHWLGGVPHACSAGRVPVLVPVHVVMINNKTRNGWSEGNNWMNEANRRKPAPGAGPPVTVKTYPVNWDDLEGETAARVLEIGRRRLMGCFYLCPMFTVSCANPTPAFFRKARRCQASWCRIMSQVLGSSNRRRAAKRASPVERQLVFTGILIVNGNHIDPREWSTFGRRCVRKPRKEVCHG